MNLTKIVANNHLEVSALSIDLWRVSFKLTWALYTYFVNLRSKSVVARVSEHDCVYTGVRTIGAGGCSLPTQNVGATPPSKCVRHFTCTTYSAPYYKTSSCATGLQISPAMLVLIDKQLSMLKHKHINDVHMT